MAKITVDPAFTGPVTADDMGFGVGLGEAATIPDYLVADNGVTEVTGSLEAQTQDNTYLRRGQVSTKTGTNRTFSVSADRIVGDAFQDALQAHAIKYGTGAKVIFPYVYFNGLTGKGEKGKVSIAITDEFSGAASEMAQFAAEFSSTDKPEVYQYPETP